MFLFYFICGKQNKVKFRRTILDAVMIQNWYLEHICLLLIQFHLQITKTGHMTWLGLHIKMIFFFKPQNNLYIWMRKTNHNHKTISISLTFFVNILSRTIYICLNWLYSCWHGNELLPSFSYSSEWWHWHHKSTACILSMHCYVYNNGFKPDMGRWTCRVVTFTPWRHILTHKCLK